ncbi:TonB family protein [Burkholderia sp. SCN-KJ]|uniref:TonB family protein n=1 Tax=Burkholderia sp. SCN-KJ TaxID=2969248 RepID=UPI0035ADA8D7
MVCFFACHACHFTSGLPSALPTGSSTSHSSALFLSPDGAKPLTRPVTVLVRALMTTSGEAQNVTVTTSSRNAAADRAAVDAMTHASCAQTGATANPFLLTQPFVFEPRRGE